MTPQLGAHLEGRRVVVSGVAAISAYGATWRGLGAALRDSTRLAGLPPETPLANPKARNARKMMSRGAYLAAATLADLMRDVGWTAEQRELAGYFLGVGASGGSLDDVTALLDASIVFDPAPGKDNNAPGMDPYGFSLPAFGASGLAACNPLLAFQLMNNFTLAHGAIFEGLGGPNGAVFSRGTGTTAALVEAVHAIASGDCDHAVAGGSDSATHPVTSAELAREGFVERGLSPAEGAALLALSVERTVSSDDRTVSSAERTESSVVRTVSSDERTVSSDERTESSDERTVSSDERTESSVVRTVSSDERTESSDVRTVVSSGARTASSDKQTLWSDARALSSVERTESSDVRTVSTAERTLSSDGRTAPLDLHIVVIDGCAIASGRERSIAAVLDDVVARAAGPDWNPVLSSRGTSSDDNDAHVPLPVPRRLEDQAREPGVVVLAAWGPPAFDAAAAWVRARFPNAEIVDTAPLGATLAAGPALGWAAAIDLVASGAFERALVIDLGVDGDVGAVLFHDSTAGAVQSRELLLRGAA